MEVNDLNISNDIFKLFDYTLNEEAKACIKKMLFTRLLSIKSITERQDILKGFVNNIELFQAYSYSKIDFREVQTFIELFNDKAYLPKRIKLKLTLSKQKHYEYRGKCVQLILLYQRLHHYVKNLPLKGFPAIYKSDILFLDSYFSSFRLNYYEKLIRENKFRIKHILEIIRLVSDKKRKKETGEFQKIYTQFEAYISIANGTHNHHFIFPDIEGWILSVQDFYHPALKSPVKNSLTTESNVVLLTGPNMSGKSTLLKAIGICAYLANIGFAIPASKAKIPFYSNLDVFINLNDDLQSGYSHFMSEIMNLKKVINQASTNEPGFAVFDELFRGTNIDDALEISRSTLKGMLNFPDSLFFVSSHLHQLTSMEEILSGAISCMYLDCNLQNDIPEFTYRLKEGTSDIKIGRILFEKENMNKLLKLV